MARLTMFRKYLEQHDNEFVFTAEGGTWLWRSTLIRRVLNPQSTATKDDRSQARLRTTCRVANPRPPHTVSQRGTTNTEIYEPDAIKQENPAPELLVQWRRIRRAT
ncbi:hypothetical protein G7043_22025 [Lentzea sp. NEAU-D13]|uniref:Uncharacterized protein n=1 Tax=Lentzea alba TaxID=2714351 RepID=A0A7C9RS61_9PSEU|nr:hypothetical protein [Lentzea alba]NGY61610.1 hypothetical protein [Lentzea alba]